MKVRHPGLTARVFFFYPLLTASRPCVTCTVCVCVCVCVCARARTRTCVYLCFVNIFLCSVVYIYYVYLCIACVLCLRARRRVLVHAFAFVLVRRACVTVPLLLPPYYILEQLLVLVLASPCSSFIICLHSFWFRPGRGGQSHVQTAPPTTFFANRTYALGEAPVFPQ